MSESRRVGRPLRVEGLEERVVPAEVVSIREGTGPNAAAILSVVADFRADLGALNANNPGSVGGGRREINWDADAPLDPVDSPDNMPPDFFNQATAPFARGAEFATPGTGVQVSQNDDPGLARFANLNPTYGTAFAAFSDPRLFAAAGSNVVDVLFFVPGTDTPATVRGFGAVFTDVDSNTSSKIEFIDARGNVLFSRNLLATPGDGSLSFLGVTFDSNAVARVRVTAGNAAPGPDDVTQGGTSDIVALDDFIYGEPITTRLTAPGPQATVENTPLTFAGGTAVAVIAGGVPTEVTLSVSRGTLALAVTEGLTVAGNGTGSVRVVGTPDRINAALNGLVYTPAVNFFGTDTLSLSAEGGFDTAEVEITVARRRVDQNQHSAIGVGAGPGAREVRVFDAEGVQLFNILVFDPAFDGGVRAATAKLTGDDVPDVVAGTGPGGAAQVQIFDGASKGLIHTIPDVYEPGFVGGIFVAAADFNGDQIADIVTTPDLGGGARVRIFDGADPSQVLADFFGIEDPDFRGGARVGVGDVNGDGFADLVVGAGFGGGPRIAVFDGTTVLQELEPGAVQPPKLFPDFFVFENTLRNGVFVAAGDLDGDGFDDVIAGAGPGGGPRVFALSGRDLTASDGADQVTVANFFGGNPDARQGIRVAVKDLDQDARDDLVVGAAPGVGPRVTTYLGSTIQPEGTPPPGAEFDAFDPSFLNGIYVG